MKILFLEIQEQNIPNRLTNLLVVSNCIDILVRQPCRETQTLFSYGTFSVKFNKNCHKKTCQTSHIRLVKLLIRSAEMVFF